MNDFELTVPDLYSIRHLKSWIKGEDNMSTLLKYLKKDDRKLASSKCFFLSTVGSV